MAESGGASVGIKFDLLVDKSQFTSAIADAQRDWKSAAQDMADQGDKAGSGFMESLRNVGDELATFAGDFRTALGEGADGVEAHLSKSYDALKAKGESMLDSLGSFGEKWAGTAGKRIGDMLGGVLKEYVSPAFDWVARKAGEALDTSIGNKVLEGAASAATALDSATNNAIALGDKVKTATDGVKQFVDVTKGVRTAASDFQALIAPLDEQIARHQKNIELIGKTTAQIAKLRIEQQNADVDMSKLAPDQKEALDAKQKELADIAAKEQAARAADEQAKIYRGITSSLDRQVQLEQQKAKLIGASAGTLAEQRAIIEAQTRMQARGRDLSDAELAAVKKRAADLAAATDAATSASGQRSTLQALEKQQQALRIEADTLGMGAGAAAAYKAEMQALSSFRERNIAVSDEFRAKIQSESAEIGRLIEANAAARNSFQLIRDAGQAVMRSLDSVFDDFISRRKTNWTEMVNSLLSDLARLSFKQALQPLLGGGAGGGTGVLGQLVAGALNGGGGVGSWSTSVIPARAMGGPVQAGMPYIVGERQPELFVPDRPGSVFPSVPQIGGGASQVHVAPPQVTVNVTAPQGTTARETGRSSNGSGMTLELLIEQVDQVIGQKIAEGSSLVGSATSQRFGLSAAAGAR